MHELITVKKKLVATTLSSRDVRISRRKEGTTMSRGEEMVDENQNHEYFEVKGEGRQRLRHVDGDFPSCMRKTKKEQHPEDDLRVWMKGRGGGRKKTTIHQW